MRKGTPYRWGKRGQSSTETFLLLPFYLTIVFGLLQIGLLGVSLVATSYAAGSIARYAAKEVTGTTFNESAYEPRLKNLLFAGMEFQGLNGHVDSAGPHLGTLTVNTCTKVFAMPFVGYFLKPAMPGAMVATGTTCDDTMGPVLFFNQPPYYFIVHGKAMARLNYQ